MATHAARSTRSAPKRPARGARPGPKKAASAEISDGAVAKATGKDWKHWLAVLDRFDVKSNGHTAGAAHLHSSHCCSGWWSQMIVVQYERARGLRVKHQKSDGFSVSVSRVIGAPVENAYAAVTDTDARRVWLVRVALIARKATPLKYARFSFVSGAGLTGYAGTPTGLEINFYAKDASRCRVTIQHNGLRTEKDAARMKAFWSKAADRLRDRVEGR